MDDQRHARGPAGPTSPETVRAYGTLHTLRALERLALGPQSASELAAGVGIGPRAARRLLRRLEAEGYAVQDGGHRRRFRATLRLAVVGRQTAAHAPLARLAAGWVDRLATSTGCVAHLWISAGDELLCVVHGVPRTTGPAAPQPMLRELVRGGDGAAATVLARPRGRTHAYVLEGRTATVASSVLERGTVVAALGVTGARAPDALAPVARASLALSRELEAALGARRR